jgi:putative peptidoglycan lipid II flippase
VVISFVTLLLLLTVGVGTVTCRLWLPVLFGGFKGETLDSTARLTYMILPGLIFLGLSGVLSATLNSFHKFTMPTLAPAVSSVVILVAVLTAREKNGIYVVGLATALGFILQCAILIPQVAALGIRFRPTLKLRHPIIPRLIHLALPLALYLIVSNGALFIERNLASRISAGAVTTLNYALRLFLVPANFLVSPLATVAYPGFTREALREGYGELRPQATKALRLVVFLFLPTTLWMVINALPLTRVLYEHGRFSVSDSLMTANVLGMYALGILPNALSVIVLRCLYAIRETRVPLWVESVALAVYAVCAVVLSRLFGVQGLAFSRSAEFVIVSAMLLAVLWRRLGMRAPDAATISFLLRAACACLTMGAVLWGSLKFLFPRFGHDSTSMRIAIVAAQFVIGAGIYLGMARLLRLKEADQALAVLCSRFGSKEERQGGKCSQER